MTQLIPDKAHFTFDNQIYQQSDVTEKGFPLEPSPADALNCMHTHQQTSIWFDMYKNRTHLFYLRHFLLVSFYEKLQIEIAENQ